jgi:hypothetical protein
MPSARAEINHTWFLFDHDIGQTCSLTIIYVGGTLRALLPHSIKTIAGVTARSSLR